MPAATLTDRRQLASESLAELIAPKPVGGYHGEGEAASEPTAWAALALANPRPPAARRAADWLADQQRRDGSVGVTASQAEPGWPTALAILAWQTIDPVGYAPRITRGVEWALGQQPWTRPRDPLFGHDTSLEGWSWAPDTHSWLEPTAFFAVALREAGYADHPRRLEAVRLLVDRLLDSGGANYGNTTVFGQELLQHVHSSGVAAWALAGEAIDAATLEPTLAYLADAVTKPTGVASLAWAVRGLAAHRRADDPVVEQLLAALPRVKESDGLHKAALTALAIKETTAPELGALSVSAGS